MDGGTLGLIGGITGGVLGTLGGIFGTYCSIRRARSPEERRFVIKWAVIVWIDVLVFTSLFFLLPLRLYWIPAAFYAITFPWILIVMNRQQQQVSCEVVPEICPNRNKPVLTGPAGIPGRGKLIVLAGEPRSLLL